jgi:hypothetical protein
MQIQDLVGADLEWSRRAGHARAAVAGDARVVSGGYDASRRLSGHSRDAVLIVLKEAR